MVCGRRTVRLSSGAAFVLLMSVFASLGIASTAPTPLYRLYQAEWGFSAITIAVVFAIYAVAVLAALLTVGRLSDHVGRRPLIVLALVGQAVAGLVFVVADGVPALVL